MADHSSRIPNGMLKDVLIKMGEFIFVVDFVVPETEVLVGFKNEIQVIFCQHILATSKTLFNYRYEKLKLTFGNMTM